MSSRQMAKAATGRRKVKFFFLTAKHTVEGYVVGMDDYHWLVAVFSSPNRGGVEITMIHKGSVDLIVISSDPGLSAESEDVRETVEQVGRAFFNHCDINFFGKN